ncbi:MAG TPA: DUF99 family protein, partial [Gemmatimonadales bacterium]|nr:DUF99 family protein [Gemmatimonadales bacterium]
MPATYRPHVLGIDDAPFEKHQSAPVPLVGVTMEVPDLIESVAVSALPVDDAGATAHLAGWISKIRTRPSLQAVLLGGITIAGLGIVDLEALAGALGLPVLAVNRRDPTHSELHRALETAGLADRWPMVERSPPARRVSDGLFLAHAGCDRAEAERLVR